MFQSLLGISLLSHERNDTFYQIRNIQFQSLLGIGLLSHDNYHRRKKVFCPFLFQSLLGIGLLSHAAWLEQLQQKSWFQSLLGIGLLSHVVEVQVAEETPAFQSLLGIGLLSHVEGQKDEGGGTGPFQSLLGIGLLSHLTTKLEEENLTLLVSIPLRYRSPFSFTEVDLNKEKAYLQFQSLLGISLLSHAWTDSSSGWSVTVSIPLRYQSPFS
ncbi:hypothetical protein HKBW3S42_00563 [Candidatus Hakubella thermalkaliphila]|uniref:Uncharacterized protein n=1 Tax=Candidatus Hakubella thermalkaliphila TaxID=2754717 RepID=A0A6V8PJ40_9ACTN|nr:hypothetical protein HKBW3S42_00563 [Candidatus Hakubella thermalkaliphila]